MTAPGPPPLPAPGERWALFLDFDGTLTEIAESPDAVRVDPGLAPALAEIARRLDGALAIVSGRTLADIDRLLAPARLPAAALHGLERRRPDGSVVAPPPDGRALDPVREALAEIARRDPRILVEDKGRNLAVHYRQAPEREGECRRVIARVLAERPALEILQGKMVLEVKPAGVDKGHAIEAFLGEAPFRGRRPVFAGDDVTDEAGFAALDRLGGITIKVGDGPSRARHRVADVAGLLEWLRALRERLPAPADARAPVPQGDGR